MGTTTTDLSLKPSDALLAEPEHLDDLAFDPRDIYMIIYKKQGSIETRHFHFVPKDETLKPFTAAIKRAQDFCQRMDYRFIHCAPFLIDLAEEERKRSEY